MIVYLVSGAFPWELKHDHFTFYSTYPMALIKYLAFPAASIVGLGFLIG